MAKPNVDITLETLRLKSEAQRIENDRLYKMNRDLEEASGLLCGKSAEIGREAVRIAHVSAKRHGLLSG